MTTETPDKPQTDTLTIGVGGMTCASCVSRVERALIEALPVRFPQRDPPPKDSDDMMAWDKAYTGAMRDYNDAVQRVPHLAVARAFGFGPGEFYQAESEQRPAVPVRIS